MDYESMAEDFAFSPPVTTAILIALVLWVGAIFLVLIYPHWAYRFTWSTQVISDGTSRWTTLRPARLNTRGDANPWTEIASAPTYAYD
jgi:hypothetical protein